MDFDAFLAEHGLVIFGATFSFVKMAIGYAFAVWAWSDPVNHPQTKESE